MNAKEALEISNQIRNVRRLNRISAVKEKILLRVKEDAEKGERALEYITGVDDSLSDEEAFEVVLNLRDLGFRCYYKRDNQYHDIIGVEW